MRYLSQSLLSLPSSSLILTHIENEICLMRQPDALFYCPCGEFSDSNPEELRKHMKSVCDPEVETLLLRGTSSTNNKPDNQSTTIQCTDGFSDAELDNPRPSTSMDFYDDKRIASTFPSRECSLDPVTHHDPPLFIPPHHPQPSTDDERIASTFPSRECSPDPVTHHDPPPFIPPHCVTQHISTLSRCGLMVDLVHKLIICVECSEAVYPPHMHTHVTHHSTPCPSLDEMLEIVDELNLKTVQLISPSDPVAPILGLSLQDGIRCTTSSCDFSFASERSYRRHCQEQHVGITPSSQPCKVHRIFKNRALQFVVRVDPTLATQHPHGTFSEYLSTFHPKQEASTQHLNPATDPRKLTAFLHNAKWHDFIRGLSLEGIQSLIMIPRKHDTLFPVVEEIHSMFKSMCEVVEGLDVLTRRHIHTPKGYVSPHLVPDCHAYLSQ